MTRGVAYLQELLDKLHEAERAMSAHCAQLDGAAQMTSEQQRAWQTEYDRLELLKRGALIHVVSGLEVMLERRGIVDARPQRSPARSKSRKTSDR